MNEGNNRRVPADGCNLTGNVGTKVGVRVKMSENNNCVWFSSVSNVAYLV
jgi:hypothetical protein